MEIRQPVLTATYRFNKTIATAIIRFIVTVAIVLYIGLIPLVYRMGTNNAYTLIVSISKILPLVR